MHKFRSVSRSDGDDDPRVPWRRRLQRSALRLLASLQHGSVVLCTLCYMKGFGEVYLCMHKYRLFRSFCAGKSPFSSLLVSFRPQRESFYGWRSGSRWASWMRQRREVSGVGGHAKFHSSEIKIVRLYN